MKFLLSLFMICSMYHLQAQYFVIPNEGQYDQSVPAQITYMNGSTEEALLITDEEKLYEYEEDGFLLNKNGKEVYVPIDDIAKMSMTRTNGTPIYMERVRINNEDGITYSKKYQKESMLLQLANVSDTAYIKIYIDPNFEFGGLESYPLGQIDKVGEEKYLEQFDEDDNIPEYYGQSSYFFKTPEEEEAIRINRKEYLEYGPIVFQGSSSFLKKYYLPKLTSTKKFSKKKTSKKKASAKKSEIVKLVWDEIPEQLNVYGKLYEYDKERKASRKR